MGNICVLNTVRQLAAERKANKMLVQAVISLILAQACMAVVYDSYTGEPATEEIIEYYTANDLLAACTSDVEPCQSGEPRRMDSSCINPEFPTSGVFHSPLRRVLPALYQEGSPDEPRLSVSGKPLPNARVVRKRLLAEGKVSDGEYTQLLAHTATLVFAETGSVHDSLNYISETTDCCLASGKSNHMCTPIPIMDDDSTHKFGSTRCLNLTRPISFQSMGCAPNDTTLARYEKNTGSHDLSFIYRPMEPVPDARAYENGLLKVDEEDNSEWPPSAGPFNTTCLANVHELNEDRCFGVVSPSIMAVNLLTVVFYRLHNVIAKELAQLNPHWDDDKLFYTTRDILIAFFNQLNYYELMPELLGKDVALKSGIISESRGFRDVYDKKCVPQASLDFMMVLRWFHVVQEGTMKMYDQENNYWKEEPITNHSLRIGFLSQQDQYAGMLRGAFLQAGAKHDHVVDAEIAETGLGNLQFATDLTANDLEKARLFGFHPYVDYLDHCGYGKPTTWEEMAEHLGAEFTEGLQELYEDPYDVDLIAGLWGEGKTETGYMPKTAACVLIEQLKNVMCSDIHWYERESRVNAFTLEQLEAIRDVNFAAVICAIEPKITTITREPLKRVSTSNPLVSCDEIKRWDLSAWKEAESSTDTETSNTATGCKYSRK